MQPHHQGSFLFSLFLHPVLPVPHLHQCCCRSQDGSSQENRIGRQDPRCSQQSEAETASQDGSSQENRIGRQDPRCSQQSEAETAELILTKAAE